MSENELHEASSGKFFAKGTVKQMNDILSELTKLKNTKNLPVPLQSKVEEELQEFFQRTGKYLKSSAAKIMSETLED